MHTVPDLKGETLMPDGATFFVPGIPIPKARPRVVRGKGQSKFPVTYTPKTTVEWEKAIAVEYKNQCPGVFFDRKVALRVYAELRMPGKGIAGDGAGRS